MLKNLNKKRKFKSLEQQKRLTNKRHYELSIINKKLFDIANHYKCSLFVMEDLNFESNLAKDIDSATREFHRQTKNIWCRGYLEKYITKRCNEDGIKLEKICPVLSSFIGNIQHDFIDPTNAAIEIARRGFLKYKRQTFYPIITATDQLTLGTMFGDEILTGMTNCSWSELYARAKSLYDNYRDFSHRWRRQISDVCDTSDICSLGSCKSRVKHVVFHINT